CLSGGQKKEHDGDCQLWQQQQVGEQLMAKNDAFFHAQRAGRMSRCPRSEKWFKKGVRRYVRPTPPVAICYYLTLFSKRSSSSLPRLTILARPCSAVILPANICSISLSSISRICGRKPKRMPRECSVVSAFSCVTATSV